LYELCIILRLARHIESERRVNQTPLTPKGKTIKKAMVKEYGAKRGEEVFYASQNKGTIKGTHKQTKKK
jgi:hypothetical protein